MYSGGSGGFLMLHCLLISGIHYADGYKNPLLTTALQWSGVKKNGLDLWKKSEVWPDNNKTRDNEDYENKIYFRCNPTPDLFYKKKYTHYQQSTKVLVYTDTHTQFLLMKLKNAYLVMDKLNNYDSQWEEFYKKIKMSDWPHYKFPNEMSSEIKKFLSENYREEIDFFGLESKNEIDVIESNVRYLKKQSDYTFCLQDILKTKFKNVTDMLNIPHKEEHNILIDNWLSLHPTEIQKHLTE